MVQYSVGISELMDVVVSISRFDPALLAFSAVSTFCFYYMTMWNVVSKICVSCSFVSTGLGGCPII